MRKARVTNIEIEFEGLAPDDERGTTVKHADPWQVDPMKLREIIRSTLDAFQYGLEVNVYVDRFGRIVKIERAQAGTE